MIDRMAVMGGVLAAALAGTAQAQTVSLPMSQRDSAYTISFSGGLDTASTQYNVTVTLPAGAADPGEIPLNYKSGFQNFTLGTTGTVTDTYPQPTGGTGIDGSLFNGGNGGTFSFGYSTANGSDFSTSWTVSTVANGHHVLAFGGIGSQGFGGCGSSFLSLGGIFTCEVFIQGDHPAGTGAGDAYITSLGSSFNVVQDFVYNGDINATIVAVSDGSWDGSTPSLGINIVGAPVPEPTTWTMMLAGFGGLGAAFRSRRARMLAGI